LSKEQEEPFTLRWSDHVLRLGQRTHVVGVLNVTPDSFSDGGLYFQSERAVERGLAMAREGADCLDVGGESTRPYSRKVSADEEMERVIPVILALRRESEIPICVDTCKADVAQEALRAGASMINDISAFRFDPRMPAVVAETGVPVVLMHMQGTPGDMQNRPVYVNLMQEIVGFLRAAIDRAVKAGVRKELILVDPGIGFGKTFDHNLQIIRELASFRILERPILLGTSRKAFIGHILNQEAPARDTGTMATIAAGVMNGAHMVRVHNVQKAVETVKVIDAIRRDPHDQTSSGSKNLK
jgi:dihydropteroate synthase